jgi:hypothetical protein
MRHRLTTCLAGHLNAGLKYQPVNMPARFRIVSKSSSQSQTGHGPRQSRSSLETSSATTMDIRDTAEPCFSYSSCLPHRHSNRDCPVTNCIAAKDQLSYDTSYTRGPLYPTNSEASLTIGMPSTSGVSWNNEIPMDNLILDQCQPFMTNESYQYSETSGSLTSGSQSMFDHLAIDPSFSLSSAPYSGYNALPPGITNDLFKHDFTSGSISYDSGSSVYTSPPTSPELQEQNWAGMPSDYGATGQYEANGNSNYVYPHLSGFSQQAYSPPSPPMSDDDPHAGLTSVRPNFTGRQLSTGNSTDDLENSKSRGTHVRYRGLDSGSTGTSARLAGSFTQISTQSSRPAQRILKPASEKPRGHDQGSQPTPSSTHAKPKEKPETVQPRNHHLYKALPGKDGLYRCPFARETQCAHKPTKQKCSYE